MESGTLDEGRVAPPPKKWAFDRRLMGIAVVTELTALMLAYVAVNVPLVGPKLTSEERFEHWPEAAIGASIVALGVLFVLHETRRARRLSPVPEVAAEPAEYQAAAHPPGAPHRAGPQAVGDRRRHCLARDHSPLRRS